MNEAIRHDQAQFRVLPADECLDTNDQSVFQADQRLIMENEFPLDQRTTQVAFHQQSIERRGIHFAGIELEVIPSHLLGSIHCGIGILEQHFQIQAIVRINADAQRWRDREFMARDFEGAPEDLNQPMGHFGRRSRMKSGHGKNEFITAQPRQGINAPHDAIQSPRHLAQQLVADTVTQRIVDALEMIQVEKNDGNFSLLALGSRQHLHKTFAQQAPIRQSGQHIVIGQFTDAQLRCLLHRNIGQGPD